MGIILMPLVTRQRPTKDPSQPGDGAPAIPESRFHVVRRSLPLSDEHAVVFIGLSGEGRVAEEIRTGWGQVAENKATEEEEGGEEVGVEGGGGFIPLERSAEFQPEI